MPCSMTFYKRAKALYDSDYEDDRIITLQALILLGWYGEEIGDVTKTASYWNGLATTVAQGSGVHRRTEKSRLPRSDQRLWKRIWWTLFTRDRSVAVALGRPVHINTDDCDVAMLCEEDFLDDEECYPAEYSPDPVQVQFFIWIYALASALNIFTYQMLCETSPLDITSQARIRTCMNALETLSRVWVAAKTVYARFETILGAKRFWRKAEGALEVVERRHSAEDTTNGSGSSQYDLTVANYGSNQAVPLQFCDRNSQGPPDPATVLTAQNNSKPSSSTYLAFQTMNLLSPARPAGYNSTDTARKGSYPSALLPTIPLSSLYGPQTSLPESHPHAKQYEYRHLVAQEKINAQGIPISFAPDVTSFPPMEPVQSMTQITADSAEQTTAAPYNFSGYEIRHGHIAMDHL